MSLRAGDIVEHFVIVSPLGEGGMGQVYLARDQRLQRSIALKILRPDEAGGSGEHTSSGAARLLREAQAAAGLEHPNVVTIFEVGEINGQGEEAGRPFIAMELIKGKSLRAYVKDTRVPMIERIRWLADTARALGAAHRVGLVHRDVKPENVMVRDDGTVKVLDFGLAKRSGPSVSTGSSSTEAQVLPSITGRGVTIGTPYYMAPEQMRRENLDGRSDQFAWGVVAYELLSGEGAWGRDIDALGMVSKILSEDPPPLEEVTPDVPLHVAAVVARAMQKKRAARFDTMDDSVAALVEGLSPFAQTGSVPRSLLPGHARSQPPPVQTPQPAPTERPAPPRARRRALVALGAVGLVGVLAAGAWFVLRTRQAEVERREASRPVTITGEPPPRSEVPAALQAYADALHALRVGSLAAAAERLDKAVALDPNLAAADLRMIPIDMELHRDPAPAYRRASELRERLSARDQDLREAYAPLIESDPVDYLEISRRLTHIAALHPNDAEIAGYLAHAEQLRSDAVASMHAAERAIALDPDFGFAWMVKGESERLQGLVAQAFADDEQCFTRFGAVDCLIEESWTAQFTGSSDALAIGRRLQTLAPESWDAARAVAGALFVDGAPLEAVRLSLKGGGAAFPEGVAPDYVDALIAMVAGDFVEAHKLVDRERIAAPMMRTRQAKLARMLVEIDEERGDGAAALEDADAFVAAMPAYSGARTRTALDAIQFLQHVLLEHGKIAPEEYDRKRAGLVAALAQEIGPEGRAAVWISAYAEPARSPEEAREALEAATQLGLPKYSFYGAPVGHVRLLAGDAKGALADLERGARATDVFVQPMAHLHTVLELGRARERSGNVAGACAPYRTVVAAWGHAKPRSVSAEEATARLAALGCDKPGREP